MGNSAEPDLKSENAALHRAISLLSQISNLVRESLELEPSCYALLTGVTAGVGLGFNRAMLYLVDDSDRSVLRGTMAVGPSSGQEADATWRSIEADAPDLRGLYEAGLQLRTNPSSLDVAVRDTQVDVGGQSPIALALRHGAPVRGEGGDDLDGLLHLPTSIAAPLRGRDFVRGVLYADNRFTQTVPDAVTEHVFALVADHAGRAIDNARRYERVALAARTDSLTGLGHHGALMEALDEAVEQSKETGEPLAFVMIDLDDFKKVNDAHGHLAGDTLLAALSDRLRGGLRWSERAYRYGGEEFAVILPGVGPNDAVAAAERIRERIRERPFPCGDELQLPVTCSVGVASLDAGMENATALVGAADEALLRAKNEGKDRVIRAN